MKTFLLYLSIALVGVGLTVAISEQVTPLEGKVYARSQAYNESMAGDIKEGDVPRMPSCAETIELKYQGEMVTTITFICTDGAARAAYVASLIDERTWHIDTVDDRIRLERRIN